MDVTRTRKILAHSGAWRAQPAEYSRQRDGLLRFCDTLRLSVEPARRLSQILPRNRESPANAIKGGHDGRVQRPDFDDHEEVVFCRDAATGLNAIIAVHDTTLGAGLGGCRFWPYAREQEALTDALRLSRGMTFKAALAGTGRGGGKSVIIGDPRRIATPDLFHAMGRFVERLGGALHHRGGRRNLPRQSMAFVREETGFVAGLESGSGDPSPATALGVFVGIQAALKHQRGDDELKGVTVAVQGLGHVGWDLCNPACTRPGQG